jgi:hypothetical protein
MPQYIYSERWAFIAEDPLNPFVQAGRFDSPIWGQGFGPNIQEAYGVLDSAGEWKSDPATGQPYNAFDPADTVLIRRVRLWSPCLGLGLAGAHTKDAPADLRLRAFTTNQLPDPTFKDGKPIILLNGLALGEWVDVNTTISGQDMATWDGAVWGLRSWINTPMTIDSSRMAADLIGLGTAFLRFQVQADIAHTLPARSISWEPPA